MSGRDGAAAMRVLHLNSMLKGGGTDDQCVKLACGLRRLGQQAWLAGPEDREFQDVLGELGEAFCPTPPEGPLKARFILSSARTIRRHAIEIVHGHHGRDLWPTILAARLSGRRPKIVLTRHMAKSPSSWFSRRFLLGQCDALVAVSVFVAKVLREGVYEPASPEPERQARPPLWGNHSKIHVIHGGIDTDRFRPFEAQEQRRLWGLEESHFAFGTVGSYDFPRGKGQREFLLAAAQIANQLPQARFLIIGRGNMTEVLQADIARLGLTGKAWLTPYCRNMPAAMNALDCLVHGQVGTEAFGLVLVEAFACGRPVIASALDGIPEAFAVGSLGRLVAPEDPTQLASAFVTLCSQPALSLDARLRLHQRVVSSYSILAHAKAVLELYERLL